MNDEKQKWDDIETKMAQAKGPVAVAALAEFKDLRETLEARRESDAVAIEALATRNDELEAEARGGE